MKKEVKKTSMKKDEKKHHVTKNNVSGVAYVEGIGRRKTSTARVRIYNKAGDIIVNNIPYKKYFPTLEMQKIVEDALRVLDKFKKVTVSAVIHGGGIHSQAEALRHGLSRAFVKEDAELRDALKKEGFLTRDGRMKERRKFGLKKARKAPQWSKR